MTVRPAGLALWAGLTVADAVASALPARVAYGLADVLGEAWYRFAPTRRRLVSANLARVCAASGRALDEAALQRLVRAAFVAHARYYLEVIRVSRYRPETIDEIIAADDKSGVEAALRAGGVVAVSAHFGNFDPAAVWMESRGLRWVAPVERIEPPELFEYLRSRRGGGNAGGELVSVRDRRRLLEGLRRGELVGVIGDRDLDGTGQEVTFFGHPARLPVGPATLVVLTGARLLAGTLRRTGRDRFAARVDWLEWRPSGNRRADVTAITQRIADTLAAHISAAPEQWWGAFQPVWPDLTVDR